MRERKNPKAPQTLISGIGYEIYKLGNHYFVDYYRGISFGYKTLEGAIEAVKYQGFEVNP